MDRKDGMGQFCPQTKVSKRVAFLNLKLCRSFSLILFPITSRKCFIFNNCWVHWWEKSWHFPPSECAKETLEERNKETFNNKHWIIALKTSLTLMKVQFGDKPKPPSSLWHMIKICFVLLICYSQITTLLLALQTQTSWLPLNYCTTFPPFFLLISTEPRRCHLHLVKNLCLQTWRQKVPIKVTNPHPPLPWSPSRKNLPGGLETHEVKLSLTRLQVAYSVSSSSDSRDFITLLPKPSKQTAWQGHSWCLNKKTLFSYFSRSFLNTMA